MHFTLWRWHTIDNVRNHVITMADVQERAEGNATSGFLPGRCSSITITNTATAEHEYEEGVALPILTFSVVGWTCKAH